ncbi:MAG: sulfatase-like hydrolase/transferase [Nitrospirae bacterium]|nr:sulfatase-like hydrolase/transferase [Nitrospirota bacterium]
MTSQTSRFQHPRWPMGHTLPGWLLALVLLPLLACTRDSPQIDAGPPPNVLVILVDALRADHLGTGGYDLPTSPTIDALAADGVVFTAAFAHSTWTKPSIATLFTSLYPGQHGIDRVGIQEGDSYRTDVLYEGYDTLAERFQAAGYSTFGVLNQVHLQSRFGFAQGFDHFEAVRGLGAGKLNQKLLQQLEGVGSSPFFAYLHYLDVHWPYTNRLEGKHEAFGTLRMESEPPRRGNRVVEWAETLDSETDLAALQARYDQEVAFVDAAIGTLMRRLQEMGLYENTIVVVTSDHGEGFLEHGKLLHSYSPYDEVLQVPLVFRLPHGLLTPVPEVDFPVGLIDLMPTLLELARLPAAPQAQGRSLVSLMRGEDSTERWIFTESAEAVAVRSATHKLIRFHDGRQEFYDLESDPGEQQPSAGPCVDLCAQLAEQLVGHQHAMSELRKLSQDGETAILDEKELEELRSLGYL